MAQYFTDFSEYAADAQPSDWTVRYVSATWHVITDPSDGTNQVLNLVSASGSQRKGLSWDAIDSDATRDDVEILMKVRHRLSVAGGDVRAMARASGTTSTIDIYCGQYRPWDGGPLGINKYVNGSFASLASSFAPEVVGTWYWVRFRVNGTALKIRLWEDGDAEPSVWDHEVTDTSLGAAGWVGIFSFTASTSEGLDIDLFGVGTNGDAAPMEAVAGGTTIEADGALNADHGLELLAGGLIHTAHTADLSREGVVAMEHLALLVLDGAFGSEHNLEVVNSAVLPVEHLLEMAFDGKLSAERLSEMSRVVNLDTDHALVVSGAGTLAMEFTAPVSVLGALNLDHALTVRQAGTLHAEHLATIYGAAILHMERAGDLLIEALGGMPIEHLATVPAEAAMNTERTLVLVTERTLPTEITAALSLDETLLTEHLAAVFGDAALPAEWAQVIVIERALNVEWDGSATFVEGIAHRFRKGRRGRVFATKGRVRLFPGRRNRDLN